MSVSTQIVQCTKTEVVFYSQSDQESNPRGNTKKNNKILLKHQACVNIQHYTFLSAFVPQKLYIMAGECGKKYVFIARNADEIQNGL